MGTINIANSKGRDAVVGAAVDDDFGSLTREGRGDGETDARGGSGDERQFIFEFVIHMQMVLF